ncbi:ABC transporter permease [Corynebacterium sp.]|uniref:ABC transporter permease n=1 Tax=Corynebacterium sp. TaxID=1720 RepID=UPI0025C68D7A|nr:ABC transporter permease [Corynebacterium sp.]
MSTQTTPRPAGPGYSRASAVRTVTGREIQVATRNKGIIATFIIVLVVVVGAIFVINYFDGRDSDNPELVVAGTDAAVVSEIAGDGVDVSSADDRDAAVAAVEDGKDAALVRTDGGFELLSDGTPDPALSAAAQAAASAIAQNDALDAVGVDPAEFAAALPDAAVTTVDLSADADEDNTAAVVTTMLGTMVVLTFIMIFAGNVGGRVTEEKSSRVVEIILATIRPIDLLVGKVLAMLVIGFLGTVVILGVATTALKVTGLLDDVRIDAATLPVLLVSFILGMLFFSALYAAAGSMVSKAEDLSSTQMPVMLIFFAVMYPPIFGWSVPDSTVMQVLSWVPPISLGVAPMRYAAGDMSLGLLVASYALLALTTALVLLLVARIYRGSILNNGRKMTWMRAIKAG